MSFTQKERLTSIEGRYLIYFVAWLFLILSFNSSKNTVQAQSEDTDCRVPTFRFYEFPINILADDFVGNPEMQLALENIIDELERKTNLSFEIFYHEDANTIDIEMPPTILIQLASQFEVNYMCQSQGDLLGCGSFSLQPDVQRTVTCDSNDSCLSTVTYRGITSFGIVRLLAAYVTSAASPNSDDDNESGEFCLEELIGHELLHAVGLDNHSQEEGDLLYGLHICRSEGEEYFSNGDIEAIETLYNDDCGEEDLENFFTQ